MALTLQTESNTDLSNNGLGTDRAQEEKESKVTRRGVIGGAL